MVDSKRLLSQWIRAFQSRDIDSIVSCYADDAVNFQVAAPAPSVGTKQIRADAEAFFRAFPDAWSEVENIVGEGDRAAWEWIGGGTFLREFLGFAPTGQSFKIRGCGFFTYRDSKIVYQRGYWDRYSWFSQIGIPTGIVQIAPVHEPAA